MALVKYNNNSISAITTAGTVPTGAMVLIKSQTASSSSTISFVDGTSDVVLDNTYPIYLFKFINIHTSNDNSDFSFNFSTDGGSNYNVTKTTTMFDSAHAEADNDARIAYVTSGDLAQSTGFQPLSMNVSLGTGNDESLSGYLYLFNPSSTTYVKHFFARAQNYGYVDYSIESIVGGYGNTTSAIDAVQFKMDSGNIDAGKIKLYGLKDS